MKLSFEEDNIANKGKQSEPSISKDPGDKDENSNEILNLISSSDEETKGEVNMGQQRQSITIQSSQESKTSSRYMQASNFIDMSDAEN